MPDLNPYEPPQPLPPEPGRHRPALPGAKREPHIDYILVALELATVPAGIVAGMVVWWLLVRGGHSLPALQIFAQDGPHAGFVAIVTGIAVSFGLGWCVVRREALAVATARRGGEVDVSQPNPYEPPAPLPGDKPPPLSPRAMTTRDTVLMTVLALGAVPAGVIAFLGSCYGAATLMDNSDLGNLIVGSLVAGMAGGTFVIAGFVYAAIRIHRRGQRRSAAPDQPPNHHPPGE